MSNVKHLCFLLLIFSACSQSTKTDQVTSDESDAASPGAQTQSADLLPIAAEDAGRTEWQNPQLVLSSLGDLTGKVVADIGAGSGYFAFKMAQSAQKVIALDIDSKALEYIDSQIEIVGDWAKNIETRITAAEIPNLSTEEADAVLIVNTYFYIPGRLDYLRRLFDCIKDNGKFVVVDYKIENTPVGPSDEFKVKPETIERELREAGFKSVSVDLQSLQYQYVISAEKH